MCGRRRYSTGVWHANHTAIKVEIGARAGDNVRRDLLTVLLCQFTAENEVSKISKDNETTHFA